jgi:hypothetical protein
VGGGAGEEPAQRGSVSLSRASTSTSTSRQHIITSGLTSQRGARLFPVVCWGAGRGGGLLAAHSDAQHCYVVRAAWAPPLDQQCNPLVVFLMQPLWASFAFLALALVLPPGGSLAPLAVDPRPEPCALRCNLLKPTKSQGTQARWLSRLCAPGRCAAPMLGALFSCQ